jgi:hypothetical protein
MGALSVSTLQSSPPAGGRFVCVRSDAISKLVCLELATDPSDVITPELREALGKLAQDQRKPLPIWVALDSAIWLSQSLEDRQRQDAALRLLILRRANYALLHKLFRVTRQRWYQLRSELNASAPHSSRLAEPSTAQIDAVYNAWHRLIKECPDEIDRWVILVNQVRDVSIPCLYKLIYEDGGTQ